MEKFIKRIFLFLAVISVYAALNFFINVFFIKKYPVKISAKKIVMGDSHTMTGINPKILGNTKNISQTAETYFITFYKLKELIKKNDFDTILLGFSFQNISAFNDDKFKKTFWSDELFNRTYSIIPLRNYKGIDLNYISYGKSIIKNMLLFPKKNHFGYVGSFSKRKNSLNKGAHNVDVTIRRHFPVSKGDIVSLHCISYLDSIVNITNQHHITLVLINTPLHSDYRAKIPEKIITSYYTLADSLKQRKGVIFLDYAKYDFNDKYFADFDHLNIHGADAFTQLIRERLH